MLIFWANFHIDQGKCWKWKHFLPPYIEAGHTNISNSEFDDQPDSLELAPYNFYVFVHMKWWLGVWAMDYRPAYRLKAQVDAFYDKSIVKSYNATTNISIGAATTLRIAEICI